MSKGTIEQAVLDHIKEHPGCRRMGIEIALMDAGHKWALTKAASAIRKLKRNGEIEHRDGWRIKGE